MRCMGWQSSELHEPVNEAGCEKRQLNAGNYFATTMGGSINFYILRRQSRKKKISDFMAHPLFWIIGVPVLFLVSFSINDPFINIYLLLFIQFFVCYQLGGSEPKQ